METTTMKPRRSRARSTWLGFSLLLGGLAACGQTSFFDVPVTIKQLPGITVDSLRMINSCSVTTSGAASDTFPLDTGVCAFGQVMTYSLGIFQYGTTSDSGTVNFEVKIYAKDQATVLGTGTAGGAIKSGGRQTVPVEVVPDPTKFGSTM
jgi:hypothetical protein